MVLRHASGVLTEHRDPHRDVSASRASLPRPSPLRTGRDNCSSSGSSLCRPIPNPRVVRVMTPPVYQLQVVQLVCSAIAARHSVVFVDEGDVLIGVEPYTTHRALAVLSLQQSQALRRLQCFCETPEPPHFPVFPVIAAR